MDLAYVRSLGRGNHRLPCPECNKSKKDSALSVTVRDDGSAVWWCWRCHASGGTRRGERVLTAHNGSLHRRPAQPDQGRQRSALAACSAIWKQTQPLAGTLGAEYLRARHCALPPVDGDLRFHPALFCPEVDREMPALIAKVTSVIGNRAIGIHRIWLRPGEAKAVAKMRLGGCTDPVCVRLWPETAIGSTLGIAEGVETALAAARKFTPMWSTIDAGQMAKFPLLAGIESLTVWADYDDVGLKSARAVWERYMYAHRNANFMRPKRVFEDACDAIARELG